MNDSYLHHWTNGDTINVYFIVKFLVFSFCIDNHIYCLLFLCSILSTHHIKSCGTVLISSCVCMQRSSLNPCGWSCATLRVVERFRLRSRYGALFLSCHRCCYKSQHPADDSYCIIAHIISNLLFFFFRLLFMCISSFLCFSLFPDISSSQHFV